MNHHCIISKSPLFVGLSLSLYHWSIHESTLPESSEISPIIGMTKLSNTNLI